MTPTTFTIEEFAKELKIERRTVSAMINEGRIPHIRIGRIIRIPGTALDALLSEAV